MTGKRLKIIGILMLVATFPASAARIFHLHWLSWICLPFIGIACSLLAVDLLPAYWRWICEPKCHVFQTESKAVADEYLRLGWTLKREWDGAEHGESTVYLLEWLHEGKPLRLNARKLAEGKPAN